MTTLRLSGHTQAGNPVVRGAFALYSTHGVPLSVTIGETWARGCVVDFADLLAEMVGEGRVREDRARRQIEEAVRDAALPAGIADAIVRRLGLLP